MIAGRLANPRLPFYSENRPDGFGYVANPAWSSYADLGLSNFLAEGPVYIAAHRLAPRQLAIWRGFLRRLRRCIMGLPVKGAEARNQS
jgi:hypothetical protein